MDTYDAGTFIFDQSGSCPLGQHNWLVHRFVGANLFSRRSLAGADEKILQLALQNNVLITNPVCATGLQPITRTHGWRACGLKPHPHE